MRDDELRKQIHRTMDTRLPGVREDPYLVQRILAEARGGKKVKKKISVGLVLGLVLLFVAATATAAILLSIRQIVDEKAVPMANEYQGESYTLEDTSILLQLAEENGIELSQNTKDQIAKAAAQGEGYYKEELIMAMAKAEFGENPTTWSLEEQKWFDDVCVAIGFVDEPQKALPSGEEISQEQAVEIAKEYIYAHYEQPRNLDDALIYSQGAQYVNGFADGEYPTKYWTIFYEPNVIYASSYAIYIDSQGQVLNAIERPGINEDIQAQVDMTPRDILSAYEKIYKWDDRWDQSILRAYREDALRSTHKDRAYLCLAQTDYPDYPPNAISKQEARDLTIAQLGLDPAQCNAHVFLIGDSPNPVLKVSLYNSSDSRSWSCEIDSITTEIKNMRELDNDHNAWWMRMVLPPRFDLEAVWLPRPGMCPVSACAGGHRQAGCVRMPGERTPLAARRRCQAGLRAGVPARWRIRPR